MAAKAAATADALLAWLDTQARSDAATAPAEHAGHPEGAATAHDGSEGAGASDVRTLDVPIAAPAAPMRLAHTDWLYHRLAIIGMAEQLAAFRRAAVGAGVVPWQLDLDRMEEDVFHLLAAPSSAAHAERGWSASAGWTIARSCWPSPRTCRGTCGSEPGVSVRSARACPSA
jgi:hypothetical protein